MTAARRVLFFLLHVGIFQAAVVRNPDGIRDDPAQAEPFPDRDNSSNVDIPTKGSSAEIPGSEQLYKGPLPKLPGTMDKPWVALHSPVKMYIPIRYTDASSAESPDCVRCPRNWTVYLRPRQAHILSPVPTLSICPSLAQSSGRVHVAVVSGPRPGQRLSAGRYPVELVLWKADGPVHSCTYTVMVKGRRKPGTPPPPPSKRKQFPCTKPDTPPGGALACDTDSEGQRRLPHGSVCQFFCLPFHSIENTTDSSLTAICQHGQWSPQNKVICIATTCPIPAPPLRGVWNCDSESEDHVKGTLCRIDCEEGHVVPTSQVQGATILCTPPNWNSSKTTARCKRAHLPKLLHCQDRHFIVREGHQAPLSEALLPKGTDNRGSFLRPVCTLRKGWELTGGEYRNECEVSDPELRTRKNCSYSIRVEESSGPHPHPDDCQNRTMIVDPGGIASLDTVRFRVSVGKPARIKELIAQCSSQKPMVVGKHLVLCTATDPATGATDTCSFFLTVKEKSCPPLLPIPNGHVICPSRGVGARCHYECEPGFSMRAHHPERICRPNLKWHTDAATVCEEISCPVLSPIPNGQVICPSRVVGARCRYQCDPGFTMPEHQAEKKCRPDRTWHLSTTSECEIQPPLLVSGCEDITLSAAPPLNISVPLPVFLTPLNETVTALCKPQYVTEPGEMKVRCESGPSICTFNVTILLKDEGLAALPDDVVNVTSLIKSEGETSSPISVNVITLLEDGETVTSSTYVNITILLEDEQTLMSPTYVTIPVLDGGGAASPTDVVNVTILLENTETEASLIDVISVSNEVDSCKPLEAPLHGYLECTVEEEGIEECRVLCEPGYGFPADQPLTVRCEDGLWDFQMLDIEDGLLDCLAEMEGTAVEVWMGFEAMAPQCDENLVTQVRAVVEKESLCPPVTRCDTSVNCTLDEESDTVLVSVNWTVQADFYWEEDEETGEEIPEAETRLEAALGRGRALLAAGEIEGLHLFRDSFRRGLITLVCPEGFKADMMAAKCIIDQGS